MNNNSIRIAIDAEGFLSWTGGVDFIIMIAEALESNPCNNVFFVVPRNSIIDKLLKEIKCIILSKGNYNIFRRLRKKELINHLGFINEVKNRSVNIPILLYDVSFSRLFSDIDKKKKRCCKENQIDVLLPSFNCKKNNRSITQIGYLYDFQHKYLGDYFTDKEKKNRDKHFKNQIINSNVILVNSKDTKKDIIKYYSSIVNTVENIPFLPFLDCIYKYNCDISKYNLPDRYFVISNQFWIHKSHDTAFRALEILFSRGIEDLHIVCTGSMDDYRNKEYINKLVNTINGYKCKNNIHLLGFIPKDEQLSIVKNSIGLIQPTLFEGGPGGGAVYNALCLGVPCLVSDIPVNREIIGYDNVYYFEPNNSSELASLMIKKLKKINDFDELNSKSRQNMIEMGEFLTKIIKREVCGE